ncbi:hypothetical protein GCM10010406_23110 [Streptomyces thermolineatus]|uniref:DksA C4-type domain-containing protein n=1 Tax=Streptomyces thermolineatus TaxID=44033 RepID=A0ABP5YZ66_9ACTN
MSTDTAPDTAPGTVNAGLSPVQLAAARDLLEEQRGSRIEQLRRLQQHDGGTGGTDGPDGPDGDGAGAGAGAARIRLVDWARMVLADVDAALARMDEGRYGVCGMCTGPVEWDRLRVVPQARYCSRCHPARRAGR